MISLSILSLCSDSSSFPLTEPPRHSMNCGGLELKLKFQPTTIEYTHLFYCSSPYWYTGFVYEMYIPFPTALVLLGRKCVWCAHPQQNLVSEQGSITCETWPVLREGKGKYHCDLFSIDCYFIKSHSVFVVTSHRILEYFVPFL